MILDAGCLSFDKESIYNDLGFDKESYRSYLRSILRSTIKAAPLCEDYTKLYFDAKHLEKEFNRGRFLGPFFQNKFPFS